MIDAAMDSLRKIEREMAPFLELSRALPKAARVLADAAEAEITLAAVREDVRQHQDSLVDLGVRLSVARADTEQAEGRRATALASAAETEAELENKYAGKMTRLTASMEEHRMILVAEYDGVRASLDAEINALVARRDQAQRDLDALLARARG